MSVQVFTGRNPEDGMPIQLTVADGLVQSIETGQRGDEGQHDDEAWLSAGLIDLQVNGFGGEDLNADSVDPNTVVRLTRKIVAAGVTTYLPTIITASEEKIVKALRAIAEARRGDGLVAQTVHSVHVEGPHISPEDGARGAHPREYARPPSLAEFDRWQNACGGMVGMVTMSPHYENSAAYVAGLVSRGVHVAIGHTAADSQQIRAAVDAGARLSTHLGNGIAGELPRHPNPLWTQMADDRLTATLIADGHHLPADTFKVMVRAKGLHRSILVSDAVALAGMPAGTYDAPVGGRVELHEGGRLNVAGTNVLAGAALALKDAIPRAMSMGGLSLADALRMATENPGRFAGGGGLLRVGEPANLIRFTIKGD
ncbi:MAG: amidohydrolase family protein, partial [Silvibacterium sp.]